MKKMKSIFSGILAISIAISAILTVSSFFLGSTLLSESFYLDIIANPTYMTKVKTAIKQDFRMQSSYSGIPENVFEQTLSDDELHTMLRAHIRNAVSYLNTGTEYIEPEYPRESIQQPMYAFLDQYAIENDIVLTAEDYTLVDEVIDDAGKVIQKHICLIDLKLVIGRDIFIRLMELVRMTANMSVPSLIILILSLAILVPVWGVKSWRKWLLWMMVGLWFPGAIFSVPSFVLAATGLTGRLAIDTPYLKYFVDSVLERTNQFFLLQGLIIFTVSSILLIFLIYTRREKSESKSNYPVLQQNFSNL
jgi:hypothetical protein